MYSRIPQTDHVLIDFRQTTHPSVQRVTRPKWLYIYFEQGYKKAAMRREGRDDKIIYLKD